MGKYNATMYRRIVARLNYLAPDRIDIQFAVKECARYMSAPRENHWTALVRIGRYLRGRPRLVMKFGSQDESSIATTFTDSDWVGCRRTAKSTSGGDRDDGWPCHEELFKATKDHCTLIRRGRVARSRCRLGRDAEDGQCMSRRGFHNRRRNVCRQQRRVGDHTKGQGSGR